MCRIDSEFSDLFLYLDDEVWLVELAGTDVDGEHQFSCAGIRLPDA